MSRSEFTELDDGYLAQYIAKYCPQPAGRLGTKLYATLVENAENKWKWSKNHSWQAWRERYKKRQNVFDQKILKIQAKSAQQQAAAKAQVAGERPEVGNKRKHTSDDEEEEGGEGPSRKRMKANGATVAEPMAARPVRLVPPKPAQPSDRAATRSAPKIHDAQAKESDTHHGEDHNGDAAPQADIVLPKPQVRAANTVPTPTADSVTEDEDTRSIGSADYRNEIFIREEEEESEVVAVESDDGQEDEDGLDTVTVPKRVSTPNIQEGQTHPTLRPPVKVTVGSHQPQTKQGDRKPKPKAKATNQTDDTDFFASSSDSDRQPLNRSSVTKPKARPVLVEGAYRNTWASPGKPQWPPIRAKKPLPSTSVERRPIHQPPPANGNYAPRPLASCEASSSKVKLPTSHYRTREEVLASVHQDRDESHVPATVERPPYSNEPRSISDTMRRRRTRPPLSQIPFALSKGPSGVTNGSVTLINDSGELDAGPIHLDDVFSGDKAPEQREEHVFHAVVPRVDLRVVQKAFKKSRSSRCSGSVLSDKKSTNSATSSVSGQPQHTTPNPLEQLGLKMVSALAQRYGFSTEVALKAFLNLGDLEKAESFLNQLSERVQPVGVELMTSMIEGDDDSDTSTSVINLDRVRAPTEREHRRRRRDTDSHRKRRRPTMEVRPSLRTPPLEAYDPPRSTRAAKYRRSMNGAAVAAIDDMEPLEIGEQSRFVDLRDLSMSQKESTGPRHSGVEVRMESPVVDLEGTPSEVSGRLAHGGPRGDEDSEDEESDAGSHVGIGIEEQCEGDEKGHDVAQRESEDESQEHEVDDDGDRSIEGGSDSEDEIDDSEEDDDEDAAEEAEVHLLATPARPRDGEDYEDEDSDADNEEDEDQNAGEDEPDDESNTEEVHEEVEEQPVGDISDIGASQSNWPASQAKALVSAAMRRKYEELATRLFADSNDVEEFRAFEQSVGQDVMRLLTVDYYERRLLLVDEGDDDEL